MNWRDQLKRIVGDLNVADDFIPNRETVEMAVLEKYSTEIIERLIEDIPNISDNFGEDGNSYVTLESLKQQLKSKWL